MNGFSIARVALILFVTTLVFPTNPAMAQSGAPDATYFGARETGATSNNRPAATPLPALATPAPSVAMAGSFAGGKPGTATAAPSVAAAASPAPTATPAARTPVGKWHWHAGPDKRLTDKGAILEDSRVVGQWRWVEQTQGKLEVRWTSGARRAPMTYTISERGNHLVGKSPESGNEHSEEKVE